MHDKILLFSIREAQPCTHAEISMLARLKNPYLLMKLDDLLDRGFLLIRDSRYSLAKGVKEHLMNTTVGAAVDS